MMEDKLLKCYEICRQKIGFLPRVALVLGSGLGDYAEHIKVEEVLDYRDIEGFPMSTVAGHEGRFVFGYEGTVPVVIMQGRVHYYEGYQMQDVVLPIRLMKLLGAEKLVLTNAAGGVNTEFTPGDFMMIKDHISSFVPSPLLGRNYEQLGMRFPDMSEVYSAKLREIIANTATELNIPLKQGVYMQFSGPQYETPAEIRMSRALGADAVGMSTVCEAIAARHMGMQVCGISCITNMASGIEKKQLNHKEVQETADRVSAQFRTLMQNIIRNL